MGMRFSFWSDKKGFFKKISNDYYITVNVLKTTELYTLKG